MRGLASQSVDPTSKMVGLKDYINKTGPTQDLTTSAIGSTNLYVGKRSAAVNSDIEALLNVKKKAKKIKNSILANRGRNTR